MTYGILLLGMLLSAALMNLMTETWVRPELNTLQHVIPLVYIPAVILFFARVRVYIVCLIAAYAYDLWFQFWSGSLSALMLISDYPVWTACAVITLIFGFAYRGFRFHWWFGALRESRNDYLDG
jgi:Na+-translocating ferredoxin:NAD+ oxidoreductase RnfE subunit